MTYWTLLMLLVLSLSATSQARLGVYGGVGLAVVVDRLDSAASGGIEIETGLRSKFPVTDYLCAIGNVQGNYNAMLGSLRSLGYEVTGGIEYRFSYYDELNDYLAGCFLEYGISQKNYFLSREPISRVSTVPNHIRFGLQAYGPGIPEDLREFYLAVSLTRMRGYIFVELTYGVDLWFIRSDGKRLRLRPL